MIRPLRRTLIAEDTFDWQKFHTINLKSYHGYQMDFYLGSNAREALKIAQEQIHDPFDLIITDLQMEEDFLPDYAGEWLIKELRMFKEYKNTPIIIVSGAYNIASVVESLGCDYISKRTLTIYPHKYEEMLSKYYYKNY